MDRLCKPLLALLSFLLAAVAPSVGWCEEGVREISPTCAVTTGCFSGDAPGYPVTIDGSAGSHYRLTGSLNLPNRNTNGIEVQADRISIDLGGFRIAYLGCETNPASCAGTTGTGIGISTGTFFSVSSTRVSNGTILGMGSDGIFLLEDSTVVDVQTYLNGEDGVHVLFGGQLLRVRSTDNGGRGIDAGARSTITESIAARNGSDGIFVRDASEVRRNAVYSNGRGGIGVAGPAARVSENLVKNNQQETAFPGVAAVSLTSGLVSSNLIMTDQSDAYFVQITDGSMLESNVMWSLAGPGGLSATSGSGYRGNVWGTLPTVPSGVNLGANLCQGALCP